MGSRCSSPPSTRRRHTPTTPSLWAHDLALLGDWLATVDGPAIVRRQLQLHQRPPPVPGPPGGRGPAAPAEQVGAGFLPTYPANPSTPPLFDHHRPRPVGSGASSRSTSSGSTSRTPTTPPWCAVVAVPRAGLTDRRPPVMIRRRCRVSGGGRWWRRRRSTGWRGAELNPKRTGGTTSANGSEVGAVPHVAGARPVRGGDRWRRRTPAHRPWVPRVRTPRIATPGDRVDQGGPRACWWRSPTARAARAPSRADRARRSSPRRPAGPPVKPSVPSPRSGSRPRPRRSRRSRTPPTRTRRPRRRGDQEATAVGLLDHGVGERPERRLRPTTDDDPASRRRAEAADLAHEALVSGGARRQSTQAPAIPRLPGARTYAPPVGWEQLRVGIELPFDPAVTVPPLTEVELGVAHPPPVDDVEAEAHHEVVAPSRRRRDRRA